MLYSILDVTDQALKDKLAITCDHQPFIAAAPMVLVFLADYRRWVRKFQQAGCEDVPAPRLSDFILAANDTVIAAHAACVAAESLGIGSCYIGDIIEQWEEHREMFGLPPYVAPVSMLVFGYPTQQQKDRPQTSRFPQKMIRLPRPDRGGAARILPRRQGAGLLQAQVRLGLCLGNGPLCPGNPEKLGRKINPWPLLTFPAGGAILLPCYLALLNSNGKEGGCGREVHPAI